MSHGYVSKVITVHNVGAYEEVELTAPVILCLGITYSWSVSCLRCFTLRDPPGVTNTLPALGEGPTVSIECEAGWVPEQFWVLQGSGKSPAFVGS